MDVDRNRNVVTRNHLKTFIISNSSRNDFLEKNEINEEVSEKVLYENMKEKKRKFKFISKNEKEINTDNSKKELKNKLLLNENPNSKNGFEKKTFNFNNYLVNKIGIFTPFKNDLNENKIETINLNETENDVYIYDRNEKSNINIDNDINGRKEESNGISIEEIFNLIVGYNFNRVIEDDFIQKFFFFPLPEDKTLSMNINKINRNENYSPKLNFNYSLEILKNNQIYFFAQVKKTFPYIKIKIYIKYFNNNYIKVGKIISNFFKNEFTLYKGDNKTNYEKKLNINYELNFFGNKIRKMIVEKFENNQIKYTLCNDLPEWDYFYKTYKLNFNGRVKQRSKKNFILKYKSSNENQIENDKLLQCGKINDNCYALDFISPLSPFEAFSISITSIISKISCD